MNIELKEAYYYKKLKNKKTVCQLCPHNCVISSGESGLCRIRKNYDGTLYALSYGRCSNAAMDPIEKKPLYHFLPGTEVLSVGTVGCNFKCEFCQNWQISQGSAVTTLYTSEQIIQKAIDEKASGIAFTYNEPIVWYEFVLDTAKLAREKGLKVIMITNGFINSEPLKELLPFIDAMNVDIKAFDNIFYEKYCGGTLADILNSVKIIFESGIHLEITKLIIPTLNDTKEHITSLAEWLASMSVKIPLHLTRYYPNYKMKIPPTDVDNILRIVKIGGKYLEFVYLGNVLDIEHSSTKCPKCGTIAIKRIGFNVDVISNEPKCKKCEYDLNIISE